MFFCYTFFVFLGLSGSIVIGEDGIRKAVYLLSMFANKQGLLKSFLKFEVINTNSVCQIFTFFFFNSTKNCLF